MSESFSALSGLANTPLFGLLLTLLSYRFALAVYQRSHQLPLFHPFLVASIPVIIVLPLVGVDYERYREQTALLSFLLGPVTVALAWPLYRQLHAVREVLSPLLFATVVGGTLAAAIAVGLAWWLGASSEILSSLAPKSITTPIAVEVVKSTGGLASLAAGAVAITGIVGALAAGQRADFVVLDPEHPRMLGHGPATACDAAVFSTSGAGTPIREVWRGGERLVAGRRHRDRDRHLERYREWCVRRGVPGS